MTIKIITVGAKPPAAMASQISLYEKRLPSTVRVEWQFLKHGQAGDVATSKHQESESILRALPKSGRVLLLDEQGVQLDNQQLSSLFFDRAEDVAIIIGGAHGVSDSVKKRADKIISLSSLVLPHQIVRLLLIEQVYRSYTISTNHPYHHS